MYSINVPICYYVNCIFSSCDFKRKEFKNSVKEKTLQYTKKNGEIVFPWQVLILTAKNN